MRARLSRLVAAFAALLAIVALALPARAAFTPPKLRGHVVDTSGALSEIQIRAFDRKLDDFRRRTGFAIVAFVVDSLEGETIEDVAYKTFNTWQIGQKGLDNGVLLVIAPNDRKTRIETGKGVGGALTDLQSNDILNNVVIPLLQQGRIPEAVDRGTTAIARALSADLPPDRAKEPRNDRARPPPSAQAPPSPLKIGATVVGLFLVIILAVVSPTFRSILWFFVAIFFRGGGGGGRGGDGGSDDDDGGSGYGGEGGSSGGGGSSESY